MATSFMMCLRDSFDSEAGSVKFNSFANSSSDSS